MLIIIENSSGTFTKNSPAYLEAKIASSGCDKLRFLISKFIIFLLDWAVYMKCHVLSAHIKKHVISKWQMLTDRDYVMTSRELFKEDPG